MESSGEVLAILALVTSASAAGDWSVRQASRHDQVGDEDVDGVDIGRQVDWQVGPRHSEHTRDHRRVKRGRVKIPMTIRGLILLDLAWSKFQREGKQIDSDSNLWWKSTWITTTWRRDVEKICGEISSQQEKFLEMHWEDALRKELPMIAEQLGAEISLQLFRPFSPIFVLNLLQSLLNALLIGNEISRFPLWFPSSLQGVIAKWALYLTNTESIRSDFNIFISAQSFFSLCLAKLKVDFSTDEFIHSGSLLYSVLCRHELHRLILHFNLNSVLAPIFPLQKLGDDSLTNQLVKNALDHINHLWCF